MECTKKDIEDAILKVAREHPNLARKAFCQGEAKGEIRSRTIDIDPEVKREAEKNIAEWDYTFKTKHGRANWLWTFIGISMLIGGIIRSVWDIATVSPNFVRPGPWYVYIPPLVGFVGLAIVVGRLFYVGHKQNPYLCQLYLPKSEGNNEDNRTYAEKLKFHMEN